MHKGCCFAQRPFPHTEARATQLLPHSIPILGPFIALGPKYEPQDPEERVSSFGLVYLWALKIGTQPFIRHYKSQLLTRPNPVKRVGICFLIGVALAEIEDLAGLGGYWNSSSPESEGTQKAYLRANILYI